MKFSNRERQHPIAKRGNQEACLQEKKRNACLGFTKNTVWVLEQVPQPLQVAFGSVVNRGTWAWVNSVFPSHLFLNVGVRVGSPCSQQPYQNLSLPGSCIHWANIPQGPTLPAQGISETLLSIRWSHFLLRLSVNLSLHPKYFQLPWSFGMLLPFSPGYVNCGFATFLLLCYLFDNSAAQRNTCQSD